MAVTKILVQTIVDLTHCIVQYYYFSVLRMFQLRTVHHQRPARFNAPALYTDRPHTQHEISYLQHAFAESFVLVLDMSDIYT